MISDSAEMRKIIEQALNRAEAAVQIELNYGPDVARAEELAQELKQYRAAKREFQFARRELS